MVLFVTLVNGFQSLTNVTKNSMLDVGRVLDRPLKTIKLLQFVEYKVLFKQWQ